MNRFKKLYDSSESVGYREEVNVLVDTETGINYLIYTYERTNGIGSGITVLVDKNGKPVITK